LERRPSELPRTERRDDGDVSVAIRRPRQRA